MTPCAALLLLLLLSVSLIDASFIAPNLQASLPLRSAMATTVRNGSMLLFGGKGTGPKYQNDLYELRQRDKGYRWRVVPHVNPAPPGIVYGCAIYDDRTDAVIVLGGSTMTTPSAPSPLQAYRYEFGTRTWQTLMDSTSNTTTQGRPWPSNRQHFDVVYDSALRRAYLAGGRPNGTNVASDMWRVDIDGPNLTFSQLPDLPAPRLGHTMSLTSNGSTIVLVGGIINHRGQGPQLASMNQLDVFDTAQGTWRVVNTPSENNPGRVHHASAVDDQGKIYIFGGDNAAVEYDMAFMNDMWILDTQSWQWLATSPQGVPPGRRSYASAAILDGKYMTVGFGSALNVWYNDINAFSLEDQNWHENFVSNTTYPDAGSSVLPPASIAGIVVGAVVGVSILLALFFFRRVVWRMVQNSLWRPRAGEPRWTETLRIASLVFLTLLFLVLLGFILRQVFTSPTVTQRYTDPSDQVAVPDIRFCFDGFPSSGTGSPGDPRVACQTDMGYDCNSDIQSLNLSLFQPTSSTGFSTCFLYRASRGFSLAPHTTGNLGSRIVFTFFANASYASSGRIHVSAYPRTRDPNVRVYQLNGTTAMTTAEVADWITNEQYNIQSSNSYVMEPLSYNGMSFNVIMQQNLVPDAWSYFGVLPHTNRRRVVESSFQQNPADPAYQSSHTDIGFLNVIPSVYAEVFDREVRVYTLLNALGFVGGVASLFFTFHTLLWGMRPNSPWGLVQRYAAGPARRSLRDGLRNSFFGGPKASNANTITSDTEQQAVQPDSNIPFVNEEYAFYRSVHDEAKPLDPEGRMLYLEDRLRLLERVVKSYYFDTEVFQQLGDAVNPHTSTSNNRSTATPGFFRIPGISRRQAKQSQDQQQQHPEHHILTAVPSSSDEDDENSNHHIHHQQQNHHHVE